jgi:hypothetical protein
VWSAHEDKVEIKCMSSVGEKIPTEPKLYLLFSLALGTSSHVTINVIGIYSYNMGDKIRRMSMNVAFEYISQKEWCCLTYGRTVHLFIMYQT